MGTVLHNKLLELNDPSRRAFCQAFHAGGREQVDSQSMQSPPLHLLSVLSVLDYCLRSRIRAALCRRTAFSIRVGPSPRSSALAPSLASLAFLGQLIYQQPHAWPIVMQPSHGRVLCCWG
jgi:hypothetical protein